MNSANERRTLMLGFYLTHDVAQQETPADHLIDAAAQDASNTQQVAAFQAVIE